MILNFECSESQKHKKHKLQKKITSYSQKTKFENIENPKIDSSHFLERVFRFAVAIFTLAIFH